MSDTSKILLDEIRKSAEALIAAGIAYRAAHAAYEAHIRAKQGK